MVWGLGRVRACVRGSIHGSSAAGAVSSALLDFPHQNPSSPEHSERPLTCAVLLPAWASSVTYSYPRCAETPLPFPAEVHGLSRGMRQIPGQREGALELPRQRSRLRGWTQPCGMEPVVERAASPDTDLVVGLVGGLGKDGPAFCLTFLCP